MIITELLRLTAKGQVDDGLAADYMCTWAARANVLAGKAGTPFVLVELPASITLNIGSAAAYEAGKYNIWFLTDQSRMDFPADNMARVDSMVDLAVDYIGRVKALRAQKLFIDNVEVSTPVVYDAADRNLTGVRLTLQLSEQQGRCIPQYTATCL